MVSTLRDATVALRCFVVLLAAQCDFRRVIDRCFSVGGLLKIVGLGLTKRHGRSLTDLCFERWDPPNLRPEGVYSEAR